MGSASSSGRGKKAIMQVTARSIISSVIRHGPAGPPEALANADVDGEIALKVAHALEHLLLKARRLEPQVANGRDVEAGEYELGEAGQSTVQGRQGQIVGERDLAGEAIL